VTPSDAKKLRAIVGRMQVQVEWALVHSAYPVAERLDVVAREIEEAMRILGRAVTCELTDADRAQADEAAGRN